MRTHHPATQPGPRPQRRDRWREAVAAIASGLVVELTTPGDFTDTAELHRQRDLVVKACRRAGLRVTTRTADTGTGTASLWVYPLDVGGAA